MKYGKSATPYLALLLILLIGMPWASHQFQKTQQVVVEVKIQKKSTQQLQVATVDDKKKNATPTLLTSK